MLKKRVIPVLLLKNDRMVKGVQFLNYRDTGDPVSQAKIYNAHDADELVFLDIDATLFNRSVVVELIQEISRECFMPLSIGGGISSIDIIRDTIAAGADKVIINSAAINNAEFITQATRLFGKQAIVISIDVRKEEGEYVIYSHSGKKRETVSLEQHIQMIESTGVGEILLNSIDQDGMMNGYEIDLLDKVVRMTDIPVVICGGAGNFEDLYQGFMHNAHAVACASLFHFGDNNPTRARSFMFNKGVPVKNLKKLSF